MKNLKPAALAILLAFACSCGSVQETPKEQQQVSKIVELPVVGIANSVTEKSFTLVTMPEKMGEQAGQTVVDTSKAAIVDNQGKPTLIKQDATVNVEGSFDQKTLYAKKVTVISNPQLSGNLLHPSTILYVRTADLIKKSSGLNLPSDFDSGWKMEEQGTLKAKPGTNVIYYKKDKWQLILVDDPSTVEKYEITVYGPNKLVWTGKQTKSDIIISGK